MMASIKRPVPEKPLRHHVGKFADPVPVQTIRKILFFVEKYLTGHSAHFAVNPNSIRKSIPAQSPQFE
ncbi:hypothetical protein [Burkholderia sp. BE17]|uniref:hypothetical protein n=1 Tax=Burkholderia sp. BE17 TaxID=2656644 RepID=UPI00128AE939|nr:hypothetical protein [Burkholderia sp. BE17]MPV68133.1 hypothetical protein [Burkholderia sp. BE17]